MAVEFTTRCVNCAARLALAPEDVRVVTCGNASRWKYQCPRCSSWVSKPADDCQRGKLAWGGAVPRTVTAPGPPLVGKLPPTGQPINEDDVIRFGREIEALANG